MPSLSASHHHLLGLLLLWLLLLGPGAVQLVQLYPIGHCSNFGVLKHIEEPVTEASTSTPPTDEWITADSIVKSWIFLTLSSTLRKRLIKANPKTAKAAWDAIETIFQENKRTRTISLKGELRVIQMGDQTADEYFSKIEAYPHHLNNLGSDMSDDDVVTYAINGLSDKYGSLAQIIAHKDPFPDLAIVRSMVATEELRLRSRSSVLHTGTTSSAPQVLLAEASSRNQTGWNNRERDTITREVCRNFRRGFCRWGDACRFLHDSSRSSGTPRNSNNSTTHRTTQGTLPMHAGSQSGGLNVSQQQQLLQLLQAQQTMLAILVSCLTGPISATAQPGFQLVNDDQQALQNNSRLFFLRINGTRQILLRGDTHVTVLVMLVSLQARATSFFAFEISYHFSHYLWVYPLRNKSDALSKFIHFRAFVKNQFQCDIKSLQCDHGGEFDNNALHQLFATNGITIRFSCPKTSQQNGKSERMIRTINNLIRTLLFQAHLPPTFWVEALHMAAHLLNILPSTAINNEIPHTRLYKTTPNYADLRVFGCLCYPHVHTNHKLEPRATPSIFLGYPTNHRGYRCLDLNTDKIILSRHVTFDETVFPYGSMTPDASPPYDFLDTDPELLQKYMLHIYALVWSSLTRPSGREHCSFLMAYFGHKYNGDGILIVTKARLVESGALSFQQPPGFRDSQHPDHVCLLQRSLYGLKQAPRAWFQRFAAYAARSIIATLHAEFSMTDLGPLNYFLGISVTRNTSGMFLSQQKYASELLERAGMLTCNPCRTPVDTDSKLSADGDPVSDPTLYRSLAGALQYLTFTRPDISYAVQQVCLYMHDPREPHFSALKRILRYIRGTMPYGLQLFSSTTSSLVAYSDADWAGCPTTRRSTSGYCVFLGNNLLSWSSKRQVTLSRSSAEAEYRGVANAVAETCWLRNLLRELHTPTATLVYCDNVSAVYLSSNPVQHQRTKHIEIDIHFVRDLVAAGHIRVLHVPSRYQYADIFTKGLPTVLFDEFRSSLSVRSSPAQTAGGC
ncbi:ribonuclease H-like domain-containing protein [Tanacetum coccineum]